MIWPSSIALTGRKNAEEPSFAEPQPSLELTIDFHTGNLQLESDWQFINAMNIYHASNSLPDKMEKVKFDLAVCLTQSEDGLVLPLEGGVEDENFSGPCSGLLSIDKIKGSNNLMLSIYLCDTRFYACEIKLELPIHEPAFEVCNN
jgi:hypothetical protein